MTPVTDKQLSFIKSLAGDAAFTAMEREITMLDVKAASTLITELKERKAKLRAAQPQTRRDPAPIGFHLYDGDVYRVRKSGGGNHYALRWNEPAREFEYIGCKYPYSRFCEATLMSREDAQAFGREFGICIVCSALLTDNERVGKDGLTSVQRGMGPVCFAKYGTAVQA